MTAQLDRRRRTAWAALLSAALLISATVAPAPAGGDQPASDVAVRATSESSPPPATARPVVGDSQPGELDRPRRERAADGPGTAGPSRPAVPIRPERPPESGGEASGDADGPAAAAPAADAAGITGITLPPVADAIRQCESGGDYSAENPVSSASGGYQFIASTWEWVTGLAPPASAYPPEIQDQAFLELWDGGAGASHWAPSRSCWAGAA